MRWATFECTMKKVEPQWPSTMPTSSASSRNSASLDRTAAHAGNTLAAELLFAVGMPVAMPPRTDPDVLHSGIRLPPRVCDGKALVGPGMKDRGVGSHASAICIIRCQFIPSFWIRRRSVCRQASVTRGHRMIGKVARHHRPQPLPLLGNGSMHVLPQPVRPGPAMELKAPLP
jgi:hypothetical protein